MSPFAAMRRQISCDSLMVTRLRRAHDVVGGRVEPFAHGGELRRGAVGELLRGHALARRRLLHFLAVLVHAGDEQRVVAVEPLEPRDRIGRDPLIGMADVRRPIGIRDRGRDVEFAAAGHARSWLDLALLSRRANILGRERLRGRGEIGEKRKDERALVEVQCLGFPRRFGRLFPYLG